MVHSNSWLGLISGITLHVLFAQASTEGVTFRSAAHLTKKRPLRVNKKFMEHMKAKHPELVRQVRAAMPLFHMLQ